LASLRMTAGLGCGFSRSRADEAARDFSSFFLFLLFSWCGLE
jgi:hypothetical protein